MEREILDLINKSSNILIITHPNPDGDTLGSASALKAFIGEKAEILVQIRDNFHFPMTYNFLPFISNAKNLSTVKDEYDLVIAVDTSSFERFIDEAKNIFKKTENTIVIDHHKTNKGYGKINFIKGGICSTGEVLFDFFKTLNVEITPEMAIGLYCAILTDTGCFKYEGTTEHTFQIARELSQIGINTSEIADFCYTNKPKNLILFQNNLISNAKFCFKDKVAYVLITDEIFKKFNAKDDYTEGIVETLRSISGVEIAFVLKEIPYGVKVSIRTKGLDATKIAEKFKGGGHKKAAGCTIKHPINTALELLLKEAGGLL